MSDSSSRPRRTWAVAVACLTAAVAVTMNFVGSRRAGRLERELATCRGTTYGAVPMPRDRGPSQYSLLVNCPDDDGCAVACETDTPDDDVTCSVANPTAKNGGRAHVIFTLRRR